MRRNCKLDPAGNPRASGREMTDEQRCFARLLGQVFADRWHDECNEVQDAALRLSLENHQDVTTWDEGPRPESSMVRKKPGKRR